MKRVLAVFVALLAVVTALHLRLNVNWAAITNEFRAQGKRLLNVGFIPVT
jgi:hypothetical protein